MIISWGAPAFAHTELVGTDPKKGSTVNKLVDAVTLTFTEPVSQATKLGVSCSTVLLDCCIGWTR